MAHFDGWTLIIGAGSACVALDAMRRGSVSWGYRDDDPKFLHRDRYPTLFWVYEAFLAFVAVWCLASLLLGTRGPHSVVFATVVLGFVALLTFAKDHDDRRNSEPRS